MGQAVTSTELEAITEDGVRLRVQRVRDAGGATREAVVMLHGLGSTSALFRVPQVALGEHLAALGYDCYLAELRGAGQSERPRGSYGLDAYLRYDVPALLQLALQHSGRPDVTWIGHSMGGFLMMMYGIDHPDAPVSRLVAIGSALDYRPGNSIYRSLRKMRPLAGPLSTLPFGLLAAITRPFAGWGPRFLPEGMNFQRSNTDRAVTRYMLANGFSPIPFALLDDLNTTFSEEGFAPKGRAPYLPRAGELRIPTLLLGGSRDLQCTPEASAATFELLTGVRDKTLRMFGKPHGQQDDYGHFDLIIGKRASDEVWPTLCAFLAAQPLPEPVVPATTGDAAAVA